MWNCCTQVCTGFTFTSIKTALALSRTAHRDEDDEMGTKAERNSPARGRTAGRLSGA